jgi:hypothetical protein
MPGTTPYAELEPDRWRKLLARAAIYHALRTRLVAIGNLAGQSGPIQSALNDLELYVNECAADDLDDETTVQRVVHAWDAVLTQRLGMTQLEADVRELLSSAQTLAREACGSDPFQRMFERISERASGLYGAAWRSPKLTLAHIGSHPRAATPQQDPYVVTARTPWPGDTGRSAVQLLIFCDAFGPAAYAALPILLVHECVCHVAAKQDRAKNDSVFAEGLLDWVAYYFLDIWASSIDVGLSPAARMHAQKLRELLSRHGTPDCRARQIGHISAETLRAWFESECDYPPHEAEARVSLLAVKLNQVDRPLTEKDVFVTKLSDPLPPKLEVALRTWEDDQDADALLAAAVAA